MTAGVFWLRGPLRGPPPDLPVFMDSVHAMGQVSCLEGHDISLLFLTISEVLTEVKPRSVHQISEDPICLESDILKP